MRPTNAALFMLKSLASLRLCPIPPNNLSAELLYFFSIASTDGDRESRAQPGQQKKSAEEAPKYSVFLGGFGRLRSIKSRYIFLPVTSLVMPQFWKLEHIQNNFSAP